MIKHYPCTKTIFNIMCLWAILWYSVSTDVITCGMQSQSPDEESMQAAWLKELWQARAKDPSRDAAGAVDGIIDGGYNFHTSEEDNPWWQVDLEKRIPLDHVTIWNRVSLWERARTITVKLSDDGEIWRVVYKHDGSEFYGYNKGEPLTVNLQGETARYLRLQLQERTMFHLDEVEVFAVADPQLNIALNKYATQSSTSQHSSYKPLPEGEEFIPDNHDLLRAREIMQRIFDTIGPAAKTLHDRMMLLAISQTVVTDPPWIKLYYEASSQRDQLSASRAAMAWFDADGLRLAIEDIANTYGDKYPRSSDYLAQLDVLARDLSTIRNRLEQGDISACNQANRLVALQREALLANPRLDFDDIVIVKRSSRSPNLGLPQNWQGNSSLPRQGFDNTISKLSDFKSNQPQVSPIYKPERNVFVGDVDLHFDANRMLFSSLNEELIWQVFEIGLDGEGLHQIAVGPLAEVDNYDPCYLPDGRIIFASDSVFQGVPCVGGADAVSNFYIMDADGSNARQLCFDQDHDWCPTVLSDGGVLFTRWEYTDTPHYFTRLLMRMNPDGTSQAPVYGSNSYWPNSMFYARPIPHEPSKFVTIVSGHHGVPRMGELIILDTSVGTREADGVVQRIPGRGKTVEPIITDQLVDNSWPKFLQPWPLDDKHFLVSCKPTPAANWGVYLVDTYDNIVLIHEETGQALLEPIPLKKQPLPPVVPDKVRLDHDDATIYMANIYDGPGLAGVPHGDVKALRVFEWHYGYNAIGGHQNVAVEGGWDVKRIIGTVPVEEDGSALFTVPANTPLSIQPINEQGEALQLMRSWFTAMPGEMLSCVGCHESSATVAANRPSIALYDKPRIIEPAWGEQTHGFSFQRDLQPVLQRKCVGCHDGSSTNKNIPNFADTERGWGGFTNSYLELHPYVRRPGPESDYHLLNPAEYRANTSELVQMLRKGHFNVQLDNEEWSRLITWIDLNVPDHGTWTEQTKERTFSDSYNQRLRFRKLYANVKDDPESILPIADIKIIPVLPEPLESRVPVNVVCDNWPLDTFAAQLLQQTSSEAINRTINLGDGVTMSLTLIPAGQFVMGSNDGDTDEYPPSVVTIEQPFWMGTIEVSNAQFARFDPGHDSRYYDQRWKDHTTPGYPANLPEQPVIRITWQQAQAFCNWLSELTGETVSLPTEAQWEYAARAGTNTDFSYGDLNSDFSGYANMADASTSRLVVQGINPQPVHNPDARSDYLPKDARYNDGHTLVANTGSYKPNAWGLYDMHGNVAEWTQSVYKPYPYDATDGRNNVVGNSYGKSERVVRGGSWRDRPKRCRSAFRLHYPEWQPVFNVGFRVVIAAE